MTGASFALPNCPSDQTKRYHNCFGTYTSANGDKYVGEFKDGKKNGKGTYTYTSGTAQEGIWKDNEFLNAQKKSELDEHKDFCTEIGLTPKTEKFGDCVLKLMDEARRRQRTLKN